MNKRARLMRRFIGAMLAVALPAQAENVVGADELLCAPHTVNLCFEHGECFSALPADIGMPEFIVIDTEERKLRATESAGDKRSSEFAFFEREGGLITLQGVENERAFSFMIHESTGLLTASVARDGFTVSAFGSCTAT